VNPFLKKDLIGKLVSIFFSLIFLSSKTIFGLLVLMPTVKLPKFKIILTSFNSISILLLVCEILSFIKLLNFFVSMPK